MRGRRETCVKTTSAQKIEVIIRILKHQKSETKVQYCETAEYVMYHKTCFNQSNIKLNNSVEKTASISQDNNWKDVRDIHLTVFKQLVSYLSQKIIAKREILALADVYKYYMRLFTEEKSSSHRESAEISFKSQHLLDKILKGVPDVSKTTYKNRVFLHERNMDYQEMLTKGFEREDDMSIKIKAVGMEIRRGINQILTRKLPNQNITLKNIIEGECDIPDELYSLINTIVQGPCVENQNPTLRGTIKQNKIASICNSIIYTASNGLTKPSTCLTLALATKSLTGSRLMINLLNRLGHCVSYSVTEEIETELAYTYSSEHRILPFDLSTNVPTHVAFDNYDQYVETSTGKDTLHDTVGIAYQNTTEFQRLSMNSLQESIDNIDMNQSRRRKYFSPFDNTVEPYFKGIGQSAGLIGNEPIIPENWKTVVETNTLWMFNHALMENEAKKWYAWHSDRLIDQNPLQKIGYLPIINASPTSDSVVLKTMNMALKLAEECNQHYIVVTYDLAIASKAYKIQADMKKEFEKLFINLGAFHIELAYFKVSKKNQMILSSI